jgi:hypothetical protein
MPNSVFFDIFFKPKFFDETCFIKELAKSMAVKLSENFTNHFSVICLFNEPFFQIAQFNLHYRLQKNDKFL